MENLTAKTLSMKNCAMLKNDEGYVKLSFETRKQLEAIIKNSKEQYVSYEEAIKHIINKYCENFGTYLFTITVKAIGTDFACTSSYTTIGEEEYCKIKSKFGKIVKTLIPLWELPSGTDIEINTISELNGEWFATEDIFGYVDAFNKLIIED